MGLRVFREQELLSIHRHLITIIIHNNDYRLGHEDLRFYL